MKFWILGALALALVSCQSRKPFDGPLALSPEKPLSLRDCAARICPAVHDPVCITYDYGGHRFRQALAMNARCALRRSILSAVSQGRATAGDEGIMCSIL